MSGCRRGNNPHRVKSTGHGQERGKRRLRFSTNFMPELQVIYDKNSRGQNYEDAQKQITGKEDYSQLGKYRQIRMTFFRNFIK